MMIDNEKTKEIQQFWGESRLNKWLLEDLAEIKISDEDKIFLATIGIPKTKPFNEIVWFFEEFKNLIVLKTYYEKLEIKYKIPIEIENSYVFANECEGICCYCVCSNSEIIYFNPEVKESLRYCNSSIELFCYFLTEFYKTAVYVKENNLDEDSEIKRIKSLIEKLKEIDLKAFETQDSFWNSVLLDFQ